MVFPHRASADAEALLLIRYLLRISFSTPRLVV